MTKNKTTKPLVSVLSIAYNHGPYIEQMIKGVLMQETDFEFEFIIHDDASTDDTAKIIEKYAREHPDIIKPIYETENQYSKGPYDFINDMFKSAKGKYIAFCEGDDYWTDPEKLQIQKDFMDSHPSYSLCFHPVQVVFEGIDEKSYTFPDSSKNKDYTLEELLHGNFIQINSVMYRAQKYDNLLNDVMPHDWYVHIYHAQFGKVGFIDRTMAVYRRHSGGVWWDSHKNIDEIWKKHGASHLKLYIELLKIHGNNAEYKKIILKLIRDIFGEFLRIDSVKNNGLLKAALTIFPEEGESIILKQAKLIKEKDHDLEQARVKLGALEQKVAEKNNQITAKDRELENIKTSKAWKLVTIYRGLRSRLNLK